MSFGIIVKRYDHYNRALGMYIRNKYQYHDELKKRGLVSFEEGQRLADKKEKVKKWKPSMDLRHQIRAMKTVADKNGNVTLAHVPKVVEVMKKNGMTFDMSKLPKHYQDQWGSD